MNNALHFTNPVWCLERCLDEWCRDERFWPVIAPARLAGRLAELHAAEVFLPSASLARLASRAGLIAVLQGPEPEPGVVALLVDEREDCGFVTPLKAVQGGWHVPGHFPFRELDLQELLLRLIHASTLKRERAVPERLAFALSDKLGERSRGGSMHVAGLLAILDAAAAHKQDLLRRACAVVEPDGDRLHPVGLIRKKLDAFRRECGTGTLLIYHPDSVAEVADYDFVRRWPVASLADLARHAQGLEGDADLLSPLLVEVELTAEDVDTAHRYLLAQMNRHYHYAQARQLADRILACKRTADVPVPLLRAVERSALDLARHLGYLDECLVGSQDLADRLRNPDAITCHDELAEADTTVAAALLHLHRFAQIESLLGPWRRRLLDDPRLVRPETRMKLINTLARSRIAAGVGGWRELIDEALHILADRDPTDRARTWLYLARGLIRAGDYDGAQRALADAKACPGAPRYAKWTRAGLEADLARRLGQQSQDEEMEKAGDPGEFSLPLASYLQATARQPRRADRAERLLRAAAVLRRDVGGDYDPGNLLHGLAALLELAAAPGQDEWGQARSRLACFLGPGSSTGLYDHYGETFDALPDVPDAGAVERLLERVPYF